MLIDRSFLTLWPPCFLLQVEKFLHELSDFNDRLNKLVEKMAELHAWMIPATEKLEFITTSQELTPEDRVKEIFDLQAQVSQVKHCMVKSGSSETVYGQKWANWNIVRSKVGQLKNCKVKSGQIETKCGHNSANRTKIKVHLIQLWQNGHMLKYYHIFNKKLEFLNQLCLPVADKNSKYIKFLSFSILHSILMISKRIHRYI